MAMTASGQGTPRHRTAPARTHGPSSGRFLGPRSPHGQVTRIFEGPLAGVEALLSWAVRVVWLNVCWFGLVLLGGVLAGIGPATVAAYVVMLAWVRGERDVPVPSTMWSVWKSCWWPATRVTVLLVAMMGSLAATWWMSRSRPPMQAAVAQGLVLVAGLVLAVIAVHLVWIIARDLDVAREQRLPIAPQFATALAVGLARPVLTATMLAALLGWPLLLVVIRQPGLLPATCISIPMAVTAWATDRTILARLSEADPVP